MFSKTKAKPFALGLALALALATAPPALAGPSFGGDLGGAVYGFFADLWQSVVSLVGADDEANLGPMLQVPNADRTGLRTEDPGDEYGPYVIPNGSLGEPGTELGPMIIPNGDRGRSNLGPDEDESSGPMIIPNGNRDLEGKIDPRLIAEGEENQPDDELGPMQIPNG